MSSSSPVQINALAYTYRQAPRTLSNSWSQISVGNSHMLGIKSNGYLFAWGYNNKGQLGLSDVTTRSSPVQIGSGTWSKVSAGYNYSLAIDTTNKLYAWGDNSLSLLGLSDTVTRSSPVQIGTSSWTAVYAGPSHAVAIRAVDSTLWSWGQNNIGQLADGWEVDPTTVPASRSSPVQISAGISYLSASVGNNYTVAIASDNTLWAWGDNSFGQIGNAIVNTTYSWSKVAIAVQYTVAIRSDGKLFGMGRNSEGQLGLSDTVARSSPTQIGTSSWSQVAAANSAVAAIKADGTLWTWGGNTASGVLGLGDTLSRSSPVQISGGGSWTTVAVGYSHAMATKTDSTLWGWGFNANGQLGDLSVISRSSPVQVSGGGSWSMVSVGQLFTAAIKTTFGLFTWGNNNAGGQLGSGDTLARSSPVQVGTSSWTVISCSPDNQYSLGITTASKLFGWGINNDGQIGDSSILSRSTPTQVGNAANNWTTVNAARNHAAGIQTDGSVWTWGYNANYQLGSGTTTARSAPVQLDSPNSYSQVAAGQQGTFAIRSSTGLAYNWGTNTYGELGDLSNSTHFSPILLGGLTVPYSLSPVQIGTSSWSSVSAGTRHVLATKSDGTLFGWGGFASSGPIATAYSWTQIEAGASHFVALRGDGTLWAWGGNANGQLGDSTIIDKSSPTQIGASLYTAIAAGLSHTVALRTDGGIFAWGLNSGGQLGLSDTLSRSSPVQVGTSSWTLIAAGQSHTVAYRTAGLYAWGNNINGQLGDGTATSRSSPVQVASVNPFASYIQINAAGNTSGALRGDLLLFLWGLNSTGQLGDSTVTARSSPQQVGTTTLFTKFSLGGDITATYTYGIRNDGTLWAWGYNGLGGLGDSTVANKSSPIQIGTRTWTTVKAGGVSGDAQAIRSDNTLWGWGYNGGGHLGDGTVTNKSSPVQLTAITAGGVGAYTIGQGAFIDVAGQLYTSGSAGAALGTRVTISRSTPLQIGVYSRSVPTQIGVKSYTSVSAGNDSNLLIDTDKTLYFWGTNTSFQAGLKTTNQRMVTSPVAIGTVAIAVSDGNNSGSFIKNI